MNDNKAVSERALRGDESGIIVDALRKKSGVDAKTVARIQYEEPTDDQCRDAWDRVLSKLSD